MIKTTLPKENALSKETTTFKEGFRAWLLLLGKFVLVLALALYIGSLFEGYGETFASIDPGMDGSMPLAVLFLVHLAVLVIAFMGVFGALNHLTIGSARLFGIYNHQKHAEKESHNADSE